MWKEPNFQGKVYEGVYDYVTKIIKASEDKPESLNWKKISSFNVGRPKNAKNPPIKRAIAAGLAVLYLAFGFLLWIGCKLFSSKGSAYRFVTCVFKWPKMFSPLIRAMATQLPPVRKTINRRAINDF